jgi:hypothetical protein
MKNITLLFMAFLVSAIASAQKNTLTNAPAYQIYEESVDKLLPSIPISNKSISKETGISEKLSIQSFQKSEEKNDINIVIEVVKYISNPLNVNPMTMFSKGPSTLNRQSSLNSIAFLMLEGDAEDQILKKTKNCLFSQVNIDPEEGSDYRIKKAGEKMKKREFGMNVDSMFNYNNSLLKGSFHDAEAKWDMGNEFRHFYYAAAGNVVVEVEVYSHKTPPEKSPDARAIANSILSKLPHNQSITEANLEVYPKTTITGDPNEYGLIPASPLLPAKIILKTGKPNVNVNFALMVNSTGELRANNQTGKFLDVTTDAKGEATVWYYYTDTKKITAPVEVQVVAEVEGKNRKAHITVGFGLAFEKISAIPEQVYIYSLEKPYAFALSVKSTFFPKLNLVNYLHAAHDSKIWGGKMVGVELTSDWVNQPDGAPKDSSFSGTTHISSTNISNSSNVLVANDIPWRFYTDISYPACVLKSEGTHIYKISGRLCVMQGDAPQMPLLGLMNEEQFKPDAIIPLSSDYPERWYKSVICSLASVNSEQAWFVLEAVKLIPTYGMIADASTTASSFLCGILNGDYQKSLIDLASWLGGQYLDNLTESSVFNTLSKKNQDAVMAARLAYFGVDQVKKKGEVEQIRENQKNRGK